MKTANRKRTRAEEATQRLTAEQRLILERAYDIPSYDANPEGFHVRLGKMMSSWSFRKDGLLPEEVAELLRVQGERCYIWRRVKTELKAAKKERWDIDHDKGSPPRVRGILCSTCNRWLGTLEKRDPGQLLKTLKLAEKYINEPPAAVAGIKRIVTFDADRPRVQLTANQLETARYWDSQGLSSKEIARKLNIRPHTIERYRRQGLL